MDLLSEALNTCDHYFIDVHNKLVVGGADRILVKHLDRVVADPNQHETIDPICKLLLMIYRCGDHQFQDSVAIVGGDLFPPLLATIFFNEGDEALLASAVTLMGRLKNNKLDLRDVPWSSSLLNLLQEIIDAVDPCTHGVALSLVMSWLVEGLLLQRENNKLFMMGHPGLFNAIVTKFANTFRPHCAANLYVAEFMKILALATTNRLEMVKNIDFLRLLFLLFHDNCIETRQVVLEILRLTALDRFGSTKVFAFLDHKFIDIATKGFDNPCLRENSFSFVKEIVANISGEILLSKRPTLLRELTKQAVLEVEHSVEAVKVVAQLAKSCSVNNGKGDLFDAILQLCKARDPRIRLVGANTLLSQAQSGTACSFFLVHLPEATDIIAKMMRDDDLEVKDTATEIVSCLASCPLNAKALARNLPLLDALAENATRNDESRNERGQRSAVVAILHLVVHHKSIETVAKQQKIVRSLSEFGSSGDQGQKLKQAALRGVACLSLYM